MLEISHISMQLGGRPVLEDISFKAENGEIRGLIGYNGVGKTTLMKILCGIYKPSGGEVLLNGKPVFENPEAKKKSFFMTEESLYFPGFSMNRMRRFLRGFYPNWSDHVYDGLTEYFGLNPDAQVSSFSKGMQRQACLTAALAAGTEMLLLDEAFDGLDEAMRRELGWLLSRYVKEKNCIMILSSHNLRELEHMADCIGLLDNGHLTYDGPVPENLEEFFLKGRNLHAIEWSKIFE